MTRFVNAVLISVVAFFGLLVLFGLYDGTGDSTPPPPPPADGAVSIAAIQTRWSHGSAGPQLEGRITLHNGGPTAATVEAVRSQADIAGIVLSPAPDGAPTLIPAGADETVVVALALPPDFATRWWTTYAAADETGSLALEGDVTVRQADRMQVLPYKWTTSWDGQLAQDIAAASTNCAVTSGLCLHETVASWQEGALLLDLQLRNTGEQRVTVRSGSVFLRFAGETVATASLSQPAELQAGEGGRTTAFLVFQADAIERWWLGHMDRCESSPVVLSMTLTADQAVAASGQDNATEGTETRTITWTLPAAPFETRLACPIGA